MDSYCIDAHVSILLKKNKRKRMSEDGDQGKEKCENKRIKFFFTKGTLFSTFQKFGKTLRCITKGVEYKMWVCRLTKSLIFDS
jgi:hypothetical protein